MQGRGTLGPPLRHLCKGAGGCSAGVQPTGHWTHSGHRSHRTGGDGKGWDGPAWLRGAGLPSIPPQAGQQDRALATGGCSWITIAPAEPLPCFLCPPYNSLPQSPPHSPPQVQGISPSPARRSSPPPAPSRRGPALPPARTFRVREGACVSPRCTSPPGRLSLGRDVRDAGDPPAPPRSGAGLGRSRSERRGLGCREAV